MDLTQLKAIAERLPEAVKTNALTLIGEMESVVEGIGDEPVAWKPPFLRLVQATTDRTKLPKGTGIGDFIIGENKVEQPFTYIPLRIWDARQYWDPDQNNNKMLCNSPDAKRGYIGAECRTCPHSQWVEDEAGKGGSACNKIKGMLAITSDLRSIFNLNFAKTSYKTGMELEGFMKKAGVAPYRRVYGMTAGASATAKNVEMFKNEILTGGKQVTPDDYLEFLKGLFDIIQADRKAMIDKFYEMTTAKAQQAALAAPSADTVLVIENSGATAAEGETKPEKTGKVSPLSKGYTV